MDRYTDQLERSLSSRRPGRAGAPLEHRQRGTDLLGGGSAAPSRPADGVLPGRAPAPAGGARLLGARRSDRLGPLGGFRGRASRSPRAGLFQRRGGGGVL